jgi:hypothetical protein
MIFNDSMKCERQAIKPITGEKYCMDLRWRKLCKCPSLVQTARDHASIIAPWLMQTLI